MTSNNTIGEKKHCVGGSVGPSAGLNDVEKRIFLTIKRLELHTLCRPARSQQKLPCNLVLAGCMLVEARETSAYRIVRCKKELQLRGTHRFNLM
jgi:hypothetical protein